MIATSGGPHAGDKAKKRTRATLLKVPTRRVARTCNDPVCNKNPYFGWHGEKAMYCVTHKEPGMVDVKNKRCEGDGCMKRGLFGFDGERARFCGGHRLEGMVDLKNKRCKWVGCAKQANFAAEGKSTARFCGDHKSPGMVDVKGRRCHAPHCTKVAGYGVPGQHPSACLLHRRTGMVDMKQHRSRLAGGKSGNINVKIGGSTGGPGLTVDGCPSTFSSKWSKHSRKNGFGGPGGGPGSVGSDGNSTSPALALDTHLDLLRPTRVSTGTPLQQWYTDPGYGHTSSTPGGEPMRSRSLAGSQQQSGAGTGQGSQSAGSWAFSNSHVSARGGSGGGGGGGQHATRGGPQVNPHWALAHEGSASDGGSGVAQGYAGSHESGAPAAMFAASCGSLPNPSGGGGARLGGGSSYGSGDRGGHNGGGRRNELDEWRSAPPSQHSFAEGFQHIPAAMSSGMAMLPDGQGGGGGGGRDGGSSDGRGGVARGSSVKPEPMTTSDMAMPDVEAEDIWLRDLMQGAMRETGQPQGGGGGGTLDMSHVPSSAAGGAQRSAVSHPNGSQHYPRHLGLAPSSVAHAAATARAGGASPSPGLREDRRHFHQQRQQQHHHHHHHVRHHRQPSSSGSAGGGGGSGNSPLLSRLTQGESTALAAGRSPSTASSGATPPHESGVPTDAMPRRQTGSHDGVAGGVSSSAGGGGGSNPGMGGGSATRGGTARGPAAPLNHLFLTLSAVSGYEGHGGGFSSDAQFNASQRISSPTWGGV